MGIDVKSPQFRATLGGSPGSTLGRVLVAVDEERSADGAEALALAFAHSFGTSLVVCTAVDRAAITRAAVTPDGPAINVQSVLDECDAAAQRLVREVAERVEAAGGQASTLVLDGRPGAAIVEAAKETGADAIVMGTHGKSGLERIMLGSTADAVLRMTTVPTFVVRRPHTDGAPLLVPRTFGRILIALDDSEPSDAAFGFAAGLAVDAQAVLLCCSVVETADLVNKALSYGYDPTPLLGGLHDSAAALIAAKTKTAAGRGIAVESIVAQGDAPEAILDAARMHQADLIVIGTHGRRGLRRLFIGSVAESVVRRSDVPVAVVRSFAGEHR
jgi:nucleotide-binding universal stress UspA family protein